jgi:hypothetical protein
LGYSEREWDTDSDVRVDLCCRFKEDEGGIECRVREFSVVELVCEDGKWKAEELRSFMDPSPTAPERRGKRE